ncbi:uncharacterized protein LOC127855163 [Dreissena polymorpha]|uniref:TNF family profile domain-containing protein n=1 Tax=Dreissena polymorpha TaxID=45954 RepID=A0A9D4CD67_DREPO|nr:uncharacterized protein LOC127855163 [Dreissena polymorpha]KAH3722007.1 hypothetical protein DPMN_064956 [Dreissena polymorpha]
MADKRQHVLLLIECLFLVLWSVILLGMTIHWRIRRDANPVYHTAELCVNCSELKPWYDPENGSRQVDELLQRDGKTCCGHADEILRYSARKQIMEEFYLQSTHSYPHGISLLCDTHEQIRPYAKLVGIIGTKPSEGLDKILWNKNGNTTVGPTIQDITHLHDDGVIVISRSGNYEVSVNLVTKTTAPTPNHGIVSYFIHVLSHRHGAQRILAERRMSFNAIHQSRSTFHGVYRLDLHDRLSVASAHLKHINISSDDNVFSVNLS